MNVCEAHSWCCCCGEIWSKRKRVFEDNVFIENTLLVSGSKTQDLNLRADLVWNMSCGPPGQWFPEIEYWVSAIFVGTSGIPPKIIYRSVKSYNTYILNIYDLVGWVLWHINLCRLFNAKSIFIQIFSSVWVHNLIVKTFLFQAIQFIQTVLIQLIQFSISTEVLY